MIVAFTGAHSTGKSTMLQFFQGKKGVVCVDSVTRSTISSKERRVDGIESLDEAQKRIAKNIVDKMNSLIEDNRKDPSIVYLLDRSVFDFLAYTKAFLDRNQVCEKTWNEVYKICEGLWDHLDLVFYLPIEFPIVDDGVRSLDESLRREVDQNIQDLLRDVGKESYALQGSVKERVKTVENLCITHNLKQSVEIPAELWEIEDPFSKELLLLWKERGMSGKILRIYNKEILVGYALIQESLMTGITIRGFYILKEFRGQGFGKDLLVRICKLYGTLSNRPPILVNITRGAEPLYEKCGFTLLGERKDFPGQTIAYWGELTERRLRELREKVC